MTEHDTDLNDLFEGMPQAARITAESLAIALQGFPLPLRGRFNIARLAEALRPAIYLAAISEKLNGRDGSAVTGKNLASLAKRARQLWGELVEVGNTATESIEQYLCRQGCLGSEGLSEPLSHDNLRVFHEGLASLDRLADLLSAVSEEQKQQKQSPKWKSAELRDWRVELAVLLTPTFEEAFERKASLMNRPYANATSPPNHWADFYQRITALAFDEKVTPNLAGVLAEARRRILKRA